MLEKESDQIEFHPSSYEDMQANVQEKLEILLARPRDEKFNKNLGLIEGTLTMIENELDKDPSVSEERRQTILGRNAELKTRIEEARAQ